MLAAFALAAAVAAAEAAAAVAKVVAAEVAVEVVGDTCSNRAEAAEDEVGVELKLEEVVVRLL